MFRAPRSLLQLTANHLLHSTPAAHAPLGLLRPSAWARSPRVLRTFSSTPAPLQQLPPAPPPPTPARTCSPPASSGAAPHEKQSYPVPSWADKLPQRLRWIHPYLSLARMDKPIGTWLLFWPCAWSLTMAAYSAAVPPTILGWNLALFGTGALVMRGAGCTINDLWDRKIDQRVERTKMRPLASGEIVPSQAVAFLGIQLSVGLAILTQLNLYSIALGASSLSLVLLYPYMKRITYWPQFTLGLAFNWGALLGSSAMLGYVDTPVALPLYAGSILWTLAYDTIYAHQDKVDDVSAGVKSTALLFAGNTKPILSAFSTGFVGLLATSGYMNGQGAAFYALSVGGAAAHLAWQLRRVDLDGRESCWSTFASNRDLGAIIWAGLAVDYAMLAAGIL